ncbi:MAG: hypothetical protein Q8Q60_03940 [Candidatus Chromulinivorax sp.]|nr:hypothetical protein [Candidatus Chromulinivorax sp.]
MKKMFHILQTHIKQFGNDHCQITKYILLLRPFKTIAQWSLRNVKLSINRLAW